MCANPFSRPKIPTTTPAAPPAASETPQLAPKIAPVESERTALNANRNGRSALRIPLEARVPGGTGLNIPNG